MKKEKSSPKPFLLRLAVVLFMAFSGFSVFGQNLITGKVLDDATNEPMIGVTILVKGTSTGTVTDLDGTFQISASRGDNLVISYMGYIEQEVKVTSDKLTINMKEDSQQLEEVVVIGYGTMQKRDITGAITSVDSKIIEERNAVNVYDALQGAAPGVSIVSSSGAPGASTSIQVRGASTFEDGGVTPLFVVDGTIVDDIDNINPTDIKNVEILKDAASASIYGARSANGVVIITTKSGEAGRPRVDFRYVQSYSKISNKLPQVNAFESRLSMAASDLANPAKTLEKFTDRTDSVGLVNSTNYYYQDLLLQTGVRNDANLNISGGTDKAKYRASLGYIGVEGVILTSYQKKYTGQFNMDYQPWKGITFTTQVRLSSDATNSINEGDVIQGSLRRDPDMIVWYPDGTLIPYYSSGGRRNPIQELVDRERLDKRYQMAITQGLRWEFTDWLSMTTNITGDFRVDRNTRFDSKERDGSADENTRKNSGEDRTGWSQKYSADSYLNFNKTFLNRHAVGATLGASMETQKRENADFYGSYFVTENIHTMNMATVYDLGNTNTTANEYALIGFFGRLNYSYGGRYILQGTMRRDGSSRFGPQSRWGWFPSASAGWRFSDEAFMRWANNVLTDGKFRLSYGITGNDKVGYYESITRYTSGSYSYNGVGGVVPVSTYGNPELRWEETRQSNIGIDLNLFRGKISIVADYYVKNTRDLLSDLNLPYTTGYNKMRVNLASLENRGWEFSVSAYPVRTRDFSWNTIANWWKNENKITDLAKDDYIQSGYWMVAKGKAAGQWYGYKNLGVFQYDVSNAYSEDYKTLLTPVLSRDTEGNVIIGLNGQPILEKYLNPDGSDYTGEVKQIKHAGAVASGGDVIWQNLPNANGEYDDKIDDSDRQILGKATPDWYASWNNILTYKDFSLSFSFYYSHGGLIYNKLKQYVTTWGGNTHKQHPEYVRTGWKYQGQITNWYALDTRGRKTMNRQELNSQYLEDGSFLRLKNVRLAYNLNNEILEKLPFNRVQAYIYGNDLLTWTNYTGFDPEIGGSVLTPGRDSSAYPRKREFGFGINVGF